MSSESSMRPLYRLTPRQLQAAISSAGSPASMRRSVEITSRRAANGSIRKPPALPLKETRYGTYRIDCRRNRDDRRFGSFGRKSSIDPANSRSGRDRSDQILPPSGPDHGE